MSGECDVCSEHTVECKCKGFVSQMMILLNEFEETHNPQVYSKIVDLLEKKDKERK